MAIEFMLLTRRISNGWNWTNACAATRTADILFFV